MSIAESTEAGAPPFVRIGRLTFRRRMALAAGSGGTVGMPFAGSTPSLVRLTVPSAGPILQIGATVGMLAVAALLGLVIGSAAMRGFCASADGAQVRIGRRVLASSALQKADLHAERAAGEVRRLSLRLRGPHASTRVWLRTRRRTLLTAEERDLLASVLRASGIEAPRSAHDPAGRFTHVNFPGALSKEEAIDVVQRSVDPDAPLPLTQ